jgi:DNA-binding transcriptional ArsR family regulator
MYKKAERLAKAIHLIAPAFAESVALRDRVDAIAVGLVDAAILPPGAARTALSRELLTLSSVLSIAQTSGLLSKMNAELISREVHFLLQEVAAYEEPRLALEDSPTLAELSKDAQKNEAPLSAQPARVAPSARVQVTNHNRKGHQKDTTAKENRPLIKDRREAILAVIQNKGSVSIKDISLTVRGVSEKTVQRELAALVEEGVLAKKGERRWSTYSIV